MTPTTAPGPPPQLATQNASAGPAEPPNWFHEEYSRGYDQLPDEARDALREHFWQNAVAPWAMQQGMALGPAHDSFMQQTQRPDKAAHPRTAVVAKQAIADLTAPFEGPMGEHQVAARYAAREAARQGISPTPYQLAGSLAGQAPYWALGLGAAGAGVEAAGITEGMIQKALTTAAGGLIQGSYDAAKAPEGNRIIEGMRGAASGAAMVGGFEAVGPLASSLRAIGMSWPEARAVQQVARGLATPGVEALAAKAVLDTPHIDEAVAQHVKQAAAASRVAGVPQDTTLGAPDGILSVTGKTADGQPYSIRGNQQTIDSIIGRLGEHLRAGGSVDSVNGDPEKVQLFLKSIEQQNGAAFALEVPEGGAQATADSPVHTLPNDTIPSEYERWWGQQPTTPAEQRADYEDWWKQTGQTAAEAEGIDLLGQPVQFGQATTPLPGGGRVVFRARKIGADDVPPLERPRAAGLSQQTIATIGKLYDNGLDIQQIASKLAVPYDTVVATLRAAKPSEVGDFSAPPDAPFDYVHKGRVRGSADIPLNAAGKADEELNARQLAGQFTEVHSGDRLRTRQTAQLHIEQNPTAIVFPPDPAWNSMARGELEGGDPDLATRFTRVLATDPELQDTPHPGVSPYSGMPGESVNQFARRVTQAAADLKARWRPGDRTLVNTHYNPIRMVESWLRAGGSESPDVDFSHYVGREEHPGEIYRWDPRDDSFTEFDPATFDPSQGSAPDGIYFNRHGRTDWNAQPHTMGEAPTAAGGADRPLATRFVGDVPWLDAETSGATLDAPAGEKPEILYQAPSREVVHHEMIHAHTGYMGLHDWFDEHITPQSMVQDIYRGAFSADAKESYQDKSVGEEVFAFMSGAVRAGNNEIIDAFARADTDRNAVLDWYVNTSHDLLDRVAEEPDSLHKRTMERRVNYTIGQASRQLEDVRRPFAATHNVDYDPETGLWQAENLRTGVRDYAVSREAMLNRLEQYAEPLNTPELVDTTHLPPVARLARNIGPPTNGRAPIHTDPPPPREDVNLGWSAVSNLIRPFNDWVGSLATKMSRPEIAQAFYDIDDGWVQHANGIRPYAEVLKESLGKYPGERAEDFMKHYIAGSDGARQTVQQEARFTSEEQEDLRKFVDQFDQLPGFSKYLRETLPEMRANDWDVETRFPRGLNTDMEGDLMRAGRLDPNDTNLARVAYAYANGRMYDTHVKPAVEAAQALVKQVSEEHEGFNTLIRPLLNRQLAYYRGQPDYTQKVVMSAVGKLVDLYNGAVDKLNSHVLPSWLQIDHISEAPRDVLRQYILLNYAGNLALRPMVPIRDAMQAVLTTLPLLGPEYMWKGMRRAFSGEGDTLGRDAWEAALHNGWMIERQNLEEMVSGGGGQEAGVASKAEDWVKRALSVISYSHNTNRLVAGWGHTLKLQDAMEAFAEHGDLGRFARQSDLWFLNDAKQQLRLKEAQALTAHPEQWEQWAQRTARDLVDATQWAYRKGTNPGLYKYQAGRLFGQYGMWPMNYIEYANKFAQAAMGPYKQEAVKAATRLVLTHGAVLSAMGAVGVDAAHWTFTQPMAYGGGPLFQAVTAIPESMDFQTYKGAEARKNLVEPFWPGMVPGYEEAHHIWQAVTAEDYPNTWSRILRAGGFTPLDAGEADKGWHKFVP